MAFGITLSGPVRSVGGIYRRPRKSKISSSVVIGGTFAPPPAPIRVRVCSFRLQPRVNAHERIATSAAGLNEAREAFRLAGVRYREGVDTQVAVYDAQAALTQAETNAVNSKYDYFIALAQLDRVTGKH